MNRLGSRQYSCELLPDESFYGKDYCVLYGRVKDREWYGDLSISNES